MWETNKKKSIQFAQISHINRHMAEGIFLETFMGYKFFLGEGYSTFSVGQVTGPLMEMF